MEHSQFNWYDFDDIESVDDLILYWNREYDHTEYSHYTNLNALNSILEYKELWISSVEKFNDKKEIKNVKDKELFFSICFSTGTSENLALWYLYSGLNGKGGRITFNKSNIKKLIKNATFKLQDVSSLEIVCNLDESNMDIWFKDVMYCTDDKSGNNVYLRYNTMTNRRISKNDFDKFRSLYYGFVKSAIWYHEKETRLMVKLKGDAANLVRKGKKINVEYRVVMNFNEIPKLAFKIRLAPEISDLNEIDGLTYLSEFRDKFSGVSLSDFKGDIEMKLCSRCTYNKCSNCDEANCSKRKEAKK